MGGWDEWCITEDAELSLRLLRRGGTGLHVDRSFGHGVMPLTFEALKRQRFRWCFGGSRSSGCTSGLLPGDRDPDNRLTQAQRWAYLVGGLQWFGDLAGLAFTGFLMVGARTSRSVTASSYAASRARPGVRGGASGRRRAQVGPPAQTGP